MHRIYFGTNRNPRLKRKRKFGRRPSGQGALRFGYATTNGEELGKVHVAPENLVADSTGRRLDPKASVLGSRTIFPAIRKRMLSSQRDIVLFIHGFATSFKKGVLRAHALENGLGSKGPFVTLFSWPSDGRRIPYQSYANDRVDAEASGPAIGRSLLILSEFLRDTTPEGEPCERRVHVLTHSMGAYVLRMALRTIIEHSPNTLPRLLDHIFLIAADEDEDAFEHDHKLRRLPELARNVHVYFNRQDKALAISDETKDNPPRLGENGLRIPTQAPSRVVQIDCTPVVHGYGLEHGYHVGNEAVLEDLRAVLAGTDPDQIPTRTFVPARNCYRLGGNASD